MIKFIRKYQLIILVVGGSLLMVVFLLQPILTRLSPSTENAKVAKLSDGTSFTRGDLQRAKAALTLLRRSNPRALSDRSMGGLGLSSESEQTTSLHWLMLADHARKYGLVGEAGDGLSWIDQIAELEAAVQVRTEMQQGLHRTPQEQEQRLLNLKNQFANMINRNASSAANSMRGSMDDVYRTLAEARGMYRLMSGIDTMPAYSDINAIAAAEQLFDAVAVDAVLIDSTLVASSIEDPSDEQLQAFFDEFKDEEARDNEFGIGYLQPTRIQMGWFTVDKSTIMNAIQVDRVELNKMWRQDRTTYDKDFAFHRAELEQLYRDEKATDIMVEADRIIRSQVLAETNGLPKRDDVLQLPEDWESRYPKLEDIAETVTERINKEFDVTLPALEVNIIGDRWLNQLDISELEGIGSAAYRIGARQISMTALPLFFAPDVPTDIGLDVQPLLPIADHAATDQFGNRYYAMVIDVREAGPADGIDDAGRERVASDYKSLKGFELLSARADELVAMIKSEDDLGPAVDAVMAMSSDENSVRPGVLQQILVRESTIESGRITRSVSPQLNTELFRHSVLESAIGLNPLLDPETLDENPIALSVALPKSRALSLALLVAPRPLTLEEFRVRANQAIQQGAGQELRDAGYFENNPFSFEALSERYGLEILLKDDDDGA